MSWREFTYLLSGLSGDTPLGRTVSIRAEENPEELKAFTPEQKRIRNEYRRKVAKQKPDEEVSNAIEGFRQMFIRLAGAQDEKIEM